MAKARLYGERPEAGVGGMMANRGAICVSATGIMAAPGATGNVIAALASFFIPGLGQLLQGKIFRALIMFVLAAVLWWFLLGWIIHLWSIIDAALYRRPETK